MSRECMFLSSLSRHNRDLEWRTWKPPQRVTALRSWIDRGIALRSWVDHVIALRQISVTALFYLEDSRKIYLWGMRARRSKDKRRRVTQRVRARTRERERERERERQREQARAHAWARASLRDYLRSSLWSSDLLLFYFRGLFPSLSFSHRHFGLLFPILPT